MLGLGFLLDRIAHRFGLFTKTFQKAEFPFTISLLPLLFKGAKCFFQSINFITYL